jgi:hypothetical protein
MRFRNRKEFKGLFSVYPEKTPVVLMDDFYLNSPVIKKKFLPCVSFGRIFINLYDFFS